MLLAFHERERGEEDRMLELVMSTEFSWETPLNVNTQIHTLHACSWSLAQAWQCSGCLGNNNNNNIIYKWCNSRTFFLRVRSERTISLHIRSSNQFGSDGRLLRSEVWRWGHTLVHICITGCAFNDTNSYRDTKITSMLQNRLFRNCHPLQKTTVLHLYWNLITIYTHNLQKWSVCSSLKDKAGEILHFSMTWLKNELVEWSMIWIVPVFPTCGHANCSLSRVMPDWLQLQCVGIHQVVPVKLSVQRSRLMPLACI